MVSFKVVTDPVPHPVGLFVDELFIGLDTAVTLVVVVVVVNCDEINDEIVVVDVETITDDVD